jgi:hypothetical protein
MKLKATSFTVSRSVVRSDRAGSAACIMFRVLIMTSEPAKQRSTTNEEKRLCFATQTNPLARTNNHRSRQQSPPNAKRGHSIGGQTSRIDLSSDGGLKFGRLDAVVSVDATPHTSVTRRKRNCPRIGMSAYATSLGPMSRYPSTPPPIITWRGKQSRVVWGSLPRHDRMASDPPFARGFLPTGSNHILFDRIALMQPKQDLCRVLDRPLARTRQGKFARTPHRGSGLDGFLEDEAERSCLDVGSRLPLRKLAVQRQRYHDSTRALQAAPLRTILMFSSTRRLS